MRDFDPVPQANEEIPVAGQDRAEPACLVERLLEVDGVGHDQVLLVATGDTNRTRIDPAVARVDHHGRAMIA